MPSSLFENSKSCLRAVEILFEIILFSVIYYIIWDKVYPQSLWTESMYREIAGIYEKQGITPAIAHIDRYISPLATHGIPRRLAELPVLVQANANFFLRRSTRGTALRMLKNGHIHLLGSDCHNLTSRQPNLGIAVDKIERYMGKEVLSLIHMYQEEILQNSC